jgi:quercetin dioxygenase-like cupin family protein
MGKVVRPPDYRPDRQYEPGIEINWAVNRQTTGAKTATAMVTVIPPGAHNPAHLHIRAEAIAYVISGRARLLSGGETFEVGPGCFAFTPPGEIHQWHNLSDTEEVRILGIYGGVTSKEEAGTVFAPS